MVQINSEDFVTKGSNRWWMGWNNTSKPSRIGDEWVENRRRMGRESATNGSRIGNGGSWNNTSKRRRWRKSVAGANKAKHRQQFGDKEWAYRQQWVAYWQRFISDSLAMDHQQRFIGDGSLATIHRQWFNVSRIFFVWVSLFLTENSSGWMFFVLLSGWMFFFFFGSI